MHLEGGIEDSHGYLRYLNPELLHVYEMWSIFKTTLPKKWIQKNLSLGDLAVDFFKEHKASLNFGMSFSKLIGEWWHLGNTYTQLSSQSV